MLLLIKNGQWRICRLMSLVAMKVFSLLLLFMTLRFVLHYLPCIVRCRTVFLIL